MHEEERTLSNDIGSQHFASDCLLHAFSMLSSRKRCERVCRADSTDFDVLQLEEVGETSTKLYHGGLCRSVNGVVGHREDPSD